MNTQIVDGVSGYGARVFEGRLSTTAVVQDEAKLATTNGEAYNINTGNITITNAAKNAVLYFKNTGNDSVIISNLIYILGTSTGGAGNLFIEVVRNPTAGTIISNAINVDMNSNLNYGSNNTLTANVYKGAVGNTFTDGTNSLGTIANVSSTTTTTIMVAIAPIILAKGSSLGINFTAPVGNTSQIVQFALTAYLKQIIET